MAESLVNFFIGIFSGSISKEAIVFIISLFPVLELRGGIIAAYALGLTLAPAFAISFIGNLLPIPFVLIAIRKVFNLLKKTRFKNIALFFEKRALNRSKQVQELGYLGLFLFVAIPLPGTGAWTGALVASLIDMDIKKAFKAILVGICLAAVIMTLISYGVLGHIIK